MAGRGNGSGVNGPPTIFDICTPRKDVRDGLVESELAADLSDVVGGGGSHEYSDPARFFAGTYPTKGIKDLLHNVLERLMGRNSSAIFWLNTSFGGGKTHALIALLHAAKSPPPDTVSEFVDPSLLPRERVRIVVFDGQNADISSGHSIGDGIMARTPWGEIAYGLAGRDGYGRVNDSIDSSPPGANTLKMLIGGGPTLILLDELAVYLRKAAAHDDAGKQFVAFLTTLIKAVESSPNAALVYTLAAGSDSGDAYRDENRELANRLMSESESVSSRKATLLNPTEEGETIQILRRRLFEGRDEKQVDVVVDAYRRAWKANRDKLPDVVDLPKTVDEFRAGYPLHPDILNTLISKTSTLENFQRVRGMLRMLGYVVHDLWKRRDKLKPTAIHLHHFDIGNEKMRLEITSKLKQEGFASAIDTDIACDDVNKASMAQKLDGKHYPDMPPFTTFITRVVFMNTLAHNQRLKGVDARHLRYSILWPGLELGYVDKALDRFKEESLYLDDDPGKPTQFQAHPNLSLAIQHAEQGFENPDLEGEIDRRIRNMFQKGVFDLLLFPDGHDAVNDELGRPKLVIPKYDRVVASNPESPPKMVTDIFRHKGIGDGIRMCRNNLVFLVAFEGGVDAMYAAARRYLAMSKLAAPDSITTYADYQQATIREKKTSSDAGLNDTILKCYKYVYYPTKQNHLTFILMDWREGGGQRFLVDELRTKHKIRTSRDGPNDPKSLVEDVVKLKKDGEITTLDFRNEFYKDTALPMLVGDEVFRAGILLGIEWGEFVYKRDEFVCGKGDPSCTITIDGDSMVYTTERARKLGVWPRKPLDKQVVEPSGGVKGGDSKKGERVTTPVPDPSSVQDTGEPSQAVRSVLDGLRKRNINRISKMCIESHGDVFLLLTTVGRIRDFEVGVEIKGNYSVGEEGVFVFDFTGTLKDSETIREFLRPQLRDASVPNIDVKLNIDFKDGGVDVDWLEMLADRLRQVKTNITISDIAGA